MFATHEHRLAIRLFKMMISNGLSFVACSHGPYDTSRFASSANLTVLEMNTAHLTAPVAC